MTSLISFLLIVALSTLIVRIGTVALTLTGLSRDVARFQARSAFTGVGFTTSESEYVVRHPVRRRIILGLMLMGNLGIVSAFSSLLLTLVESASPQERLVRILWLVLGLGVIWMLGTSKWVDRYLTRWIEWALRRWTRLEVRDYEALLQISGGFQVAELEVEPDSWLAGKTLAECRLNEEGVLVLGIFRPDGTYIGAPRGQTEIHPGDLLVLYGRAETLEELSHRLQGAAGDAAHERAVHEQELELERERLEDELSAHRLAAAEGGATPPASHRNAARS